MKKLHKKQWVKKVGPARNRTQNTKIYNALAELELNEALEFFDDEWKAKTSPRRLIPSLTKASKRKGYEKSPRAQLLIDKKFSIRKTAQGWIVIRVM